MPVCLMVKDRLKSRHRLFNDFPRVKSLFGHLRVRVRWSSLRARAVCCWHWRGPVASEPCRWRAWDLGRWEPGGDPVGITDRGYAEPNGWKTADREEFAKNHERSVCWTWRCWPERILWYVQLQPIFVGVFHVKLWIFKNLAWLLELAI
jgi:hypothetical protein